jgi:pyridoxamine 5'-phosphate oxidase
MPTSPQPTEAPTDPILRFKEAFERARQSETDDASAVTLATADRSGAPSARMVLLRGVDDRGFVFFTNRGSRKGRELGENARAALCFHWPTLGLQIRIEGGVVMVADEESDAYFATRERGSQIGAWASPQSDELSSRAELLERVREIEARFGDGPVPRPPFWGGYRVIPRRIEFWRAGESRLHERIRYERTDAGWTTSLLAP